MTENDVMMENMLDKNTGKPEEKTDKTDGNIDKKEQRAFIYIVKCQDGSLYTGITKNLKKRMGEHYHKTGRGAKYTRSRQVVEIMMVWEAVSYSSAAKLEYKIKRLARKDKLKVIASPEEGLKELVPGLSKETYIPRKECAMNVDKFLA